MPAPPEVTGSISGGVTDRTGAPVSRATVLLLNGAGGVARSAASDAAGRFTFLDVVPGTYEVLVQVSGFSSKPRGGVAVAGGKVSRIVVMMPIGEPEGPATAASGQGALPHGGKQPDVTAISPKHEQKHAASAAGAGPPPAPAPPGPAPPPAPAAPAPPPASVSAPAVPGSAHAIPPAVPPAAPHHVPSAVPQAAPAVQPASTGSVDAAEEAWFDGLQNGLVEWTVPPKMVLSESDPVTVRLHGYKNAGSAADALPGGNGQAALKISTQMKVELVSAGGDDLTVTPVSEQGVRYVPATGFTDWSWMLTPVHSAKQEKLRLTVEAVFDADHSRTFVTYSRPFVIEVASPGSMWDYIEEHFGSLAKYWGPGGAGFLAIAGVIAWWRKRRAATLVTAVNRAGD